MTVKEPAFTLGIEEEYLLVDRDSRDLASDPPQQLLAECSEKLANLVKPEFLKSQIEVATGICSTIDDARQELGELRATVAQVAANYGLAPIAASTHPFSEWQHQHHSEGERYDMLANDMQGVARRLLICGMHVHVGIDDDELRIDLMNQASYFLPHLLALSTSSPFWRGENTGLMSYRLSVFNELPRTGLPERFDSYAEYLRHIDVLVAAGSIRDASMMWWDIRPSANFPTLEMRISDVCTFMEDTLSIAALYQCIIRMLYRLRRNNQRWRMYAPMLINENRWRAQRYGLNEGLLDFGRGEIVPCQELIGELLGLIAEDAQALNCQTEVKRITEILENGTSAHHQIATYDKVIEAGGDRNEALQAIVDMLIEETVRGL
ncbi:MAG TPA: carboxylate-amine ligase [Rhodospirillales bacterium]|nr:carboxylate-amine ligase [Rhodospirillales bacterium]